MRQRNSGNVLAVRAIAGLHVTTIAWDLVDLTWRNRADFLGFALGRAEVDANGAAINPSWIPGIKRFRGVDDALPPGTLVPSATHPIQSFQWGDYTAKPDTAYEYVVAPVVGTPGNCQPDMAAAQRVRVKTERPTAPVDAAGAKHDVHFNRGVAGSQAYAREFPGMVPDENQPNSPQMRWLSRGLFEALTGFIASAAGADAADYGLRCMFYEFHYAPVAEALKTAANAGADVAIRYEAQSYKDVNEQVISQVGIQAICEPQKVRAGIRHNKFMVLLHHNAPVAVWTGSTNISAGGIFGHSNVGHVIHDAAIAKRYLDYWEALADEDVTTAKLRTRNMAVEPSPAIGDLPPADRVPTYFSPRDKADPHATTATLAWYADLLASAREIACMTFAFNFDPVFQKAVQGQTDALSYLVFDKALDDQQETEVRQNRNTILAVGGKLEQGDMELFLGEHLTGFNKNRYIHDKFLLVDPLSNDPIVITGTANFSEPSQEKNDENMIAIRGDTRVADIYFGEFMRIFDHHYTRYIIARLKASGQDDPNAGFLKPVTADWLDPQYNDAVKSKRRRFFVG